MKTGNFLLSPNSLQKRLDRLRRSRGVKLAAHCGNVMPATRDYFLFAAAHTHGFFR